MSPDEHAQVVQRHRRRPRLSFGDKLPGASRGAAKNYSVMSVNDICAMQLPPIADNALLFMWRVASQAEEAMRVIRAWGFVPKSEIVWLKQTKTGKRHFGMGRYTRAEHETCVIASRGRGLSLIRDHAVRSTFSAPVGRHSEKPDAFFEMVAKLVAVDAPRVELFSRRQREGWTCLGDDLGTHIASHGDSAPSKAPVLQLCEAAPEVEGPQLNLYRHVKSGTR